MYSISPCPVITTKTITSFKIDRIEISLFKSAVITVILLDSAGSLLDLKFVNMSGENYSKWSADDSYVVEFIKQSLGFSNVGIPVETPVEITITETPVEITITDPPVETPSTETPVEITITEPPSTETPVETPVEITITEPPSTETL